jgi:hypothetical protein
MQEGNISSQQDFYHCAQGQNGSLANSAALFQILGWTSL